jgi:acetylglutamate kinase
MVQSPSSSADAIHAAEATRVQILSEALPYIQQFRGRTVVVK